MNARMFAVIAVLVTTIAVRGDEPAKQATTKETPIVYELKFGIYQGDPLGDRESGDLKVLAEPTIVFRRGTPASFLLGHQTINILTLGERRIACDPQDVGYKLNLTAEPADTETIKIKIEVSHSAFDKTGGFTYHRMTSIKSVKPDQPVRCKFGEIDGKLTWVEWQIRPIEGLVLREQVIREKPE